MTTSLDALVSSAPSGRRRPLLIDHRDYATTVIRQGVAIPWGDLAALTAHVAQVHALLDPDVTWLDVEALYGAQLMAAPERIAAMAERSRTGYALRTLLGDPAGVEEVIRTAATLAESTRRQLLVSIPSPARWLVGAHAIAGQQIDAVDADRADSASMYIAEWLGRLGSLPIALVCLDARGPQGRLDVDENVDDYSAIRNVCDHFEWTLALRHEVDIEVAGEGPTVGQIPQTYWFGGADVPGGDALVATIPADASPERVLDQLSALA